MRRLRRLVLALATLVVVALGFNAISAGNETERAKADIGRVLELPGGDLQVREDGDPDDPPIVLLHGYASSVHWWEPVVPELARDHRVIRIDLLGHGGSAKPRHGYSMKEQARQVALALGQLNVEAATVVGHSMGGFVGGALATDNSELVDRLVVVDTPPSEEFVDPSLLQSISYWPVLGPALNRLATDGVVRKGLEDAFAPGFDIPDQFVRDVKRLTWSAYKSSDREIDRFLDAKPLDARITAAAVPLLVIFGEQDSLVEPEAAEGYRDVPGARIALIDGAGHTPMAEKPEQTARLILEFAQEAGDEAESPER